MPITRDDLESAILRYTRYTLGREWGSLSAREQFLATSLAIREHVIDAMLATERRAAESGAKRVYYLSMEFLAGRALSNNLQNLGLHEMCRDTLAKLGVDLEDVEGVEPDPALGNGGLGRLAACFLDSMATLGMAGYGYGINFEFGLFKQGFDEQGRQVESPDVWRSSGTPWLIQRPELARTLDLYGRVEPAGGDPRVARNWVDTVKLVGIPSDLPIVGFLGKTVNYLRLYSARSVAEIDIERFNAGDYVQALAQNILSERISKVLYPNDDVEAGRELRLLQEYFFVACALRDIVDRHGTAQDDLRRLPDRAAIQLNDTHPALAIPELMRLLIDEHGFDFPEAFAITRRTIAYTNHTLLPEAQETWHLDLLGRVLPRHLELIYAINEEFLKEVDRSWPGDDDRRRRVSLIDGNGDHAWKRVRMMHLAVVGSHSVNGVSKLHSSLIQRTLAPDFHSLWPTRFNNKTNGVTQRRWLLNANPELSRLLSARIGDGWILDLEQLRGLEDQLGDRGLQDEFRAIKRKHKERLAAIIRQECSLAVDPGSLFDVHVKRIHEYKRQLLNALRIVHEYLALVEDGREPETPRTYVFGGKAAPSYRAAKRIIHLIHSIARRVHEDERTRGLIRVAFLPDYRVTLAERIIPAADVSEHISTAGMEASGTGNMKFMMNGALTVGTLDGANIEMLEEAGADNLYIFGLTADRIESIRSGGGDKAFQAAQKDPRAARVLKAIEGGMFGGDDTGFPDLARSLRDDDRYFVVADLAAFLECQSRVARDYKNQDAWARRCLINIARSGRFSSDRTVREYGRDVWGVLA